MVTTFGLSYNRTSVTDTDLARFKLHLRPDHIPGILQKDLPVLPPGKSAIDVMGDFLGYMYGCVRKYLQESHASGDSLWKSVEGPGHIDFVLSHPNGWEGLQQSKMRQAAICANLIPHTETGRDRIHFVSEGEASLHFCLDSGLASEVEKVRCCGDSYAAFPEAYCSSQVGAGVIIIDAGGGTIDLSTYSVVTASPIAVEEVSTPDCRCSWWSASILRIIAVNRCFARFHKG